MSGYMDRFNQHDECRRIPTHMLESIARYAGKRIPPGSFLTAMLSNDMMEALGRADEHNRYLFWEYGYLFYNCLPVGSYGSPEAVSAWLKGDDNG